MLNHQKIRFHFALDLMEVGAVLTPESHPNHPLVITRPSGERGFLLQLHEKNPEAPLSPYFFNLRTVDNPKPGPLDQTLIDTMAECLYTLALQEGLLYDCVAGVPNAGDPPALAFSKIQSPVPCLKLIKGEVAGKRAIVSLEGDLPATGIIVLLVDDLITAAGSKLMAIKFLQENYGLVIKDVLVLIDREQGGRKELARLGYNLHSIFTQTELFALYAEHGKISPQFHATIQAYQAANS